MNPTTNPSLALEPPDTAPRDGTVILAAVGWPWLVPAAWSESTGDWTVFAREGCDHEDQIHGWLPMPLVPDGTPTGGFLPATGDEPVSGVGELEELRDAVRRLSQVEGRFHTQLAVEYLIALLPADDGTKKHEP